MIRNEKEVCEYLCIPSVPKKKWDGKKSFKNGVAVTELVGSGQAYAVATFDAERDKEPRIKHTFNIEPFSNIGDIYVVPSYMDTDVDVMDFDDVSKRAAKVLVEEAKELEEGDGEEKNPLPANEYFFDHIHNDEEAAAYIKSYNKANKIRARIPKTHDELVMRLSVIWSESKQK